MARKNNGEGFQAGQDTAVANPPRTANHPQHRPSERSNQTGSKNQEDLAVLKEKVDHLIKEVKKMMDRLRCFDEED